MKILFIRFSAIGDLVLASPAFRCAKNQLPGVELHLLTKANLKAVTEANPYIDRFHYFDGDFGSTLADLKAENFDWVVDLHKNLRSYRFRWALKKPSLAYKKASIEKWWLTKMALGPHAPTPHQFAQCGCLGSLRRPIRWARIGLFYYQRNPMAQ